MVLAHAGLGILVAGITASSAWQTEKVQFMRAGDTVDVSGYLFTFEGAKRVQGPNYVATRGTFKVTRNGAQVAVMTPEKRDYPAERSNTTEAAIRTLWSGDLYAVLGDERKNEGWSTRVYHNPLVAWIWIGAMIMALGGMVSLTDRRLRVGAPRRAAGKAGIPDAASAGA